MSGGAVAPVMWLDKPVNLPWVCSWCKCGDHARSAFLDTGLSFDFEGTVYLCEECAKNLRQHAGWFTEEEFAEGKEELQKRILELEAQVADYEIIKEVLTKMGISPVGLKRVKLAPEAVKEELRGRLNSAQGSRDTVATNQSTNGSESKADESVDGIDAKTVLDSLGFNLS